MNILQKLQDSRLGVRKTLNPKPSGLESLVTEIDPKSTASEAFRILKTNLSFKNLEGNLKYIALTSAIPAEGKSTTTANLAITLAQGGKKVILVDADLRRPTQHKKFGLVAFEGLTNALVEGTDPLTLLKPVNGFELRLLTAGPLPPNPSEILGSRRMKSVLERLGTDADFVIVDCPPTLGLNDTLALSPHVDGFLLVVGSGTSTKNQVITAKEHLDKVGANFIGVVLNGLKLKDSSYYYSSTYTS